MKISESQGEIVFDAGGACGKKLHVANGCEFVVLTLSPGSEIAPHVLDIAVSFYVISGEGKLVSDGVSSDVASGDLIETTAGSERSVSHSGDNDLKLLVIKHVG